jgi:hypothetical protein
MAAGAAVAVAGAVVAVGSDVAVAAAVVAVAGAVVAVAGAVVAVGSDVAEAGAAVGVGSWLPHAANARDTIDSRRIGKGRNMIFSYFFSWMLVLTALWSPWELPLWLSI